jgi:hypothetical protein
MHLNINRHGCYHGKNSVVKPSNTEINLGKKGTTASMASPDGQVPP